MTLGLVDMLEKYAAVTFLQVIEATELMTELTIDPIAWANRPKGSIFNLVGDFHTTVSIWQNDSSWLDTCGRVNKFCLLAGCPKAFQNPFDSIDALRAIALQPFGREAQLQAETKLLGERIEEMKRELEKKDEKIKEQDEKLAKHSKIVTCLSYRHLMEQLPGPGPGQSGPRWADFWTDAIGNAMATTRTDHPLVGFLQKYGQHNRTENRIKTDGGAMYGLLSTDIHHYNGGRVYDVNSLLWPELHGGVIKALAPDPKNFTKSGDIETVDWVKERARYDP